MPLVSRDGETWVLDEPRKGDRFLLGRPSRVRMKRATQRGRLSMRVCVRLAEPERLLETNKSLSAAAAATLIDFETHLADPNKSFLDADDAR